MSAFNYVTELDGGLYVRRLDRRSADSITQVPPTVRRYIRKVNLWVTHPMEAITTFSLARRLYREEAND